MWTVLEAHFQNHRCVSRGQFNNVLTKYVQCAFASIFHNFDTMDSGRCRSAFSMAEVLDKKVCFGLRLSACGDEGRVWNDIVSKE